VKPISPNLHLSQFSVKFEQWLTQPLMGSKKILGSVARGPMHLGRAASWP